MEGAFAPSIKMVAGTVRICKWKPKNQAIRLYSARVISWVLQKNEFSRGAMEKLWIIKDLTKKGIIKSTKRVVSKVGKAQGK